MSDETRMEETMNTELTPVENEYPTEISKGSSTVAKVVIVGVCGAVAGGIALGARKLKERNEKKTIERLRKKGWYIEEPVKETEDEFLEDFEDVSDDEILEETNEK